MLSVAVVHLSSLRSFHCMVSDKDPGIFNAVNVRACITGETHDAVTRGGTALRH